LDVAVGDQADGESEECFERASVGPPEWDLVSTAVKMTTTGAVTEAEYAEFARRTERTSRCGRGTSSSPGPASCA
jgi:hypothetical protein